MKQTFILCLVDTWYRPAEIRFKPDQVKWLLQYRRDLEHGLWPEKPQERVIKGSPSYRAPFENACQIIGELNARLNLCRTRKDGVKDRVVVLLLYSDPYNVIFTINDIADFQGSTTFEVQRRALRCLKYISGWRRRRISYDDWVNHRKGSL